MERAGTPVLSLLALQNPIPQEILEDFFIWKLLKVAIADQQFATYYVA
ncbi:hypothetical protein [Scytonema sp. NUACC21]